jgi:hypothetical protein
MNLPEGRLASENSGTVPEFSAISAGEGRQTVDASV